MPTDKIDFLSEFLNWERWDDGDFDGWKIPSINNALIKWYNEKCVDGKEYLKIHTMEDFLLNINSKYKASMGITQSVMSFSYSEVENNMFSEFDINYPFARIGFADCGVENTGIPLRISMTRADCSNWIMTNFGGNHKKIAEEIWDIMDKGSFDIMYTEILGFLIEKGYAKLRVEWNNN